MTDRNLDNTTGVRMALTYVLPQINSSTTVAGFSPMQWVLGKQVTLPGKLCGERLSSGQLDGYNFENVLKNRTDAKTALAQAERRLQAPKSTTPTVPRHQLPDRSWTALPLLA